MTPFLADGNLWQNCAAAPPGDGGGAAGPETEGTGPAGRLYRDCIEHAPCGVMVHDAAGRILVFNAGLQALSGFVPGEIPDGRSWVEKLYPEPGLRRILSADKKIYGNLKEFGQERRGRDRGAPSRSLARP